MFQIYDSLAKKPVGKPYQNRARARSRADRLDNEYGAYRYQVRNMDLERKAEALSMRCGCGAVLSAVTFTCVLGSYCKGV